MSDHANMIQDYMEVGELIAKSFLTCSTQDGRGIVQLDFKELKDAQECHSLLCSICNQWFEKHIQNLRPKEDK